MSQNEQTSVQEEEEEVCRICRISGEDDNPLFYPCACSGSIKFVHQNCLVQWLEHSNKKSCEVCKREFSFSPLYAPDAPPKLSTFEFLLGLLKRIYVGWQFTFRVLLVVCVWLFLIPYTTFWIFRLTFIRSFHDAQLLFSSRFSPLFVLVDCVYGLVMSVGMLGCYSVFSTLRERYLRNATAAGQQDGRNLELQAADADLPDNEDDAEPRPGGVPEPPHLAAAAMNLMRNPQILRDDFLDAHEFDETPLEDLIGITGPILNMLETALYVQCFNAVILAIILLLPFTMGRITFSLITAFHARAIAALRLLFYPVLLLSSTVWSAYSFFFPSPAISPLPLFPSSPAPDPASFSMWSDIGTLALGYFAEGFFLWLFLLAYVGATYVRYRRANVSHEQAFEQALKIVSFESEQSVQDHPTGVETEREERKFAMFVKVGSLLFLELVAIPLLIGYWLDLCTLPLFSSSASPAHLGSITSAALFLHWLAGLLFMVGVTLLVSVVREVVRPGLLFFLRDPSDPDFDPLRDLREEPIRNHMRRLGASAAIYLNLVVVLAFLPVAWVQSLAPGFLPLRLAFNDPLTEIPTDMLLFHLLLPLTVEHLRPRQAAKTALHLWLSTACSALGLTEFILPSSNAPVPAPVPAPLPDSGVPPVIILPGSREGLPRWLTLRVILLVFLGFLTICASLSVLLLLPVFVGRFLFHALTVGLTPTPQLLSSSLLALPLADITSANDLYCFGTGCYVLWATVAGARHLWHYFQQHSAKALLLYLLKWAAITVKAVLLLSVWLGVIPVLAGLLFELLVLVPLRVPVDASPVFQLYQDWAMGVIFLKLWTRMAMNGQATFLTGGAWREKLQRVKADGLTRLNAGWVWLQVVGPVLASLLTCLCFPYAFVRGLLPLLGLSARSCSAAFRFAWLACALLLGAAGCARHLAHRLSALHNSIRDERYLVGRQLHNFGPAMILL